jgi:pyruvate-formate lyase-activating enzyme
MGEPLMRLDMVLEITKWLTRKGIPVRLDTIGHAKLLYPERNVAFKNAYFMMLKFAREITKAGMELRFTIMDLPIVDTGKCRKIARLYDADFMVRIFF